MISNREIRRLFSLYAELLDLHRQDAMFAKALSSAAYYTRRFREDIMFLDKARISQMFRPPIARLLFELQKTETIAALDELIQLTPAGLFELMRIKGLGGKKLAIIWHVLKIDTMEGLLKACQDNKLSKIPGFGTKTESNIIKAIESYTSHRDHFRYATVADAADQLVLHLQKIGKTRLISLCGDIRRKTTTLARIEILAAKKFTANSLKKYMIVQSSTKAETRGISVNEIPVTIYHTAEVDYFPELFRKTGHENHVKKVLSKVRGKLPNISEEAIYAKAKMPFVPPDLREDNAEWDFTGKLEALVTLKDIKGVVHNHTTYSDGVDTLQDFVKACIDKKFEYTVISDHSKNAHYAGGLKEEKVLRQFEEIDTLNKAIKPFRIFKSIECDIRVSGELDFDDAFLEKFDLVIVSIHQLLKMDEAKATKRLIRAIENPYTTILGHMTGRLLLIRSGYPVDFKKVIDACAASGVVIEINANPYRLDMDWSHIPYAMKKGVMISVNPDAHSIKEIDNIRWGIAAARKGGLTGAMTWNAMSLKNIEIWLNDRFH
jgi:DNA polymerase (family 10)